MLLRAAAVVLVLVALPALASEPEESREARYMDPTGDGEPDIVAARWALLGDGAARRPDDPLLLEATVRGNGSVRLLWADAVPGAEPTDWYLAVLEAGAARLFSRTDAEGSVVPVEREGDAVRLTVPRDDAPAGCVYLAVEAGTVTPVGFTRTDIAPDGLQELADIAALDAGGGCPTQSNLARVTDKDGGKDAPLGPLAMGAIAGAVFVLRRR